MKRILFAIIFLGTLTHAITTNASVLDWFTGLFGSGGVQLGAATSTRVQNLFIADRASTGFILAINSAGLVVTSTDATGGAGGGSVSTSSAITVDNYPFWVTVTGGLSGTSTLTRSGSMLLQNGDFNATGTITQSGVAVLTSVSSTIPALPVSIANGGTATNTTPTTNALMYFDGTFIRGTSTIPFSSYTGESYLVAAANLLTGGTISDTHMTAEDFGEFTCDSNEDGCTLDDTVTVTGWTMGASVATTPSADDNDTSLATTAYVQTELNAAGGNYITCSSGSCNADAELASSSMTFAFPDATSTSPYKFLKGRIPFDATVVGVACDEVAAATSTMSIYRVDSNASYAASAHVVSSIACGINGTSTVTFTSSTIPANTWLLAVVTSTAGTPTMTNLSVLLTKTD